MPDAIPQTISEPPVNFLQFDLNTGHPEIVEPAPGYFSMLLNALIETHWGGLAGGRFEIERLTRGSERGGWKSV